MTLRRRDEKGAAAGQGEGAHQRAVPPRQMGHQDLGAKEAAEEPPDSRGVEGGGRAPPGRRWDVHPRKGQGPRPGRPELDETHLASRAAQVSGHRGGDAAAQGPGRTPENEDQVPLPLPRREPGWVLGRSAPAAGEEGIGERRQLLPVSVLPAQLGPREDGRGPGGDERAISTGARPGTRRIELGSPMGLGRVSGLVGSETQELPRMKRYS